MKTTVTTTLQKLANATKTFYDCGGHGKAERNDIARKKLERQLEREGQPVPALKELLAIGKFNGEGAC